MLSLTDVEGTLQVHFLNPIIGISMAFTHPPKHSCWSYVFSSSIKTSKSWNSVSQYPEGTIVSFSLSTLQHECWGFLAFYSKELKNLENPEGILSLFTNISTYKYYSILYNIELFDIFSFIFYKIFQYCTMLFQYCNMLFKIVFCLWYIVLCY